ncbi:uncharacterized protein ASCRUDRAFT_107656 [Ascoidea rubescens DSM 1968]|uniref:Uncharacterized protein n=1 Tax=Ascoidea rubescens DSM 1968 TaxID=1344418 RepID=A0A1D2VE08_9ASCO|nr:hypothetical protein ASCRUDRAFT_107656 [Ascoidea rubescens DSM 1968]ODV59866.1 hypothetical protein ASCRUDRAFT_107656 [Ascoidea rubescens DSM 1968]
MLSEDRRLLPRRLLYGRELPLVLLLSEGPRPEPAPVFWPRDTTLLSTLMKVKRHSNLSLWFSSCSLVTFRNISCSVVFSSSSSASSPAFSAAHSGSPPDIRDFRLMHQTAERNSVHLTFNFHSQLSTTFLFQLSSMVSLSP